MIFSAKELDIPKILILISSYTKTKSARDYILNMTPSTDLIEIETSLRQTEDINNHLLRVGQLPLIEDFDIFEILKLLPRGFILSGSDIMQIRLFLTMEKSVLEAFLYAKKLNITYNIIHEQISLITNHQSLLKMIDSIFDERGIIYDNASPGLSKIRRNISLKQKELDDKMRSFLDKYKDYLAENIITTRNNRYCIPVNITYKNKIKGTVLDISKTGQTVYIEPEVAFNIQSELEYLAVLENEEIQKILSILTNEIASSYDNLMKNLDIFLLLDVLHAKAMYARDIDGVMPRVNKEGKINIIKGRHPLIKKEQVVPIDVILNNEFKTMIITGPNTGGKTVALKTTGIFSVMTQMGILVSCDPQSDIAIFDNIFADIGDEQSIEQSLSTFSSHLKKIKNIMDNAKSNDLVLIDEIGSGTDPQEGSSLAIAILNHLRKKNLRLMVTTHYSDLKIYALENDGIMSASVAFDEKTLSPLYYLVLGSSGTSNAFLIAKRMGIESSILDDAYDILNKKETDLSKTLNKLNQEKLEVAKKEAILSDQIKHYESLLFKHLEDKKLFDENKEKLLKNIEQKEKDKWENLKEELKDLISNLRNKEIISLNEAASLKNKINQNHKTDDNPTDDEELLVGDSVYIRPYQKYGKIVSIRKNDLEVSFGDFKMRFKRDDLKKTNEIKEEAKNKSSKKRSDADLVSKDAKLEVDLRGYRFDDVKDALEKAIDKAIVSNLNMLYVIHGFGTLAVKKAVMEVIKKSPYVKSFRPGGEGEGLNGVTVVLLK